MIFFDLICIFVATEAKFAGDAICILSLRHPNEERKFFRGEMGGGEGGEGEAEGNSWKNIILPLIIYI